MDVNRIKERLQMLWTATGGSNCCGWMVDEVAFYLYSLIKIYRPDLVIQTGHLWGKSSLFILEALTDGFLETNRFEELETGKGDAAFTAYVKRYSPLVPVKRKLVSVDPEPYGVNNWSAGIRKLSDWYGASFEFHKMTSEKFFQEFRQQLMGKRTLVMVDGDHTREGCGKDLENAKEIGARIILVDDTSWLPELDSVARDFAELNGYSYLNLALYNGIGLLA